MDKNCKEVVDKLEAKIGEYEKLIEEMMQAPKQVGTVAAGPYKDPDGKTYFRAEVGGNQKIVFYKDNKFFKEIKDVPKIGMEVILLQDNIVGVTPPKLMPEKELPKFDLISWNNVGGLKSQVNKIREAIEIPMQNEALVKEFGLQPIKGILLYGPPGTGKTLIAKAIASTILKSDKADTDSFVYIKGAELLSMYVGATEAAIRGIFARCRKYSQKTGKRAVIFLDEAEALLPVRGSRHSSDVDTTIVPTFLSEMDGFDNNSPIMILSTNMAENLDPAIVRDGRIDIKLFIDRPTEQDAREIFLIHLSKVKCHDELPALVEEATKSLFGSSPLRKTVSGAMIENIVKSSTRIALNRRISDKKAKVGVSIEDLKMTIDEHTEACLN